MMARNLLPKVSVTQLAKKHAVLHNLQTRQCCSQIATNELYLEPLKSRRLPKILDNDKEYMAFKFRIFNTYMCVYNYKYMNFMFAPCIDNIKHFIVQLIHRNYKILRLLK
jgi:hypothetical protein